MAPMIASQSADPLDQFTVWFAEAEKREPGDANAMTVATAGPEGTGAVLTLFATYIL